MYKVAVIAAFVALAAQTGFAQTNGGSEVPTVDVEVTSDLIESYFNGDLFFVSNFSIQAVVYDLNSVGNEVDSGDGQNVAIPAPMVGERAAMLDYSAFGVLSFFGIEAATTTVNYAISFWYFSTTSEIVLALNTDTAGGVTPDFFLLPATEGEWVLATVDIFETFGDIAWFGFQFRNFANEDRLFFIDELIITVPLPPNDCNGLVDPALCPCGLFSVICGTPGPDFIGGTSDCDCIYGFGGADTIYGNGGDDWIWGGAGNDKIFGGNGDDFANGEGGFDTIYGGLGDDALYGGLQADILYGGNGNDRLFGEAGNDRMYGEANSDKLFGGAGADILYSGLGLDTLNGGAGKDILVSQDNLVDTLNGGPLIDTAYLSTTGCAKHVYIGVEKVINNNAKTLSNC